MKKKIFTKVCSAIIAAAIMVTGVSIDATTVNAQEKSETLFEFVTQIDKSEYCDDVFDMNSDSKDLNGEYAVLLEESMAGKIIGGYFTPTVKTGVDVEVYATEAADTKVQIGDSVKLLIIEEKNIASTDWQFDQAKGCYVYSFKLKDIYAANTQYIIVAEATQDIEAIGLLVKEAPQVNKVSDSVTVGFTKQLSVVNGSVKKWSSSNKKIATVSSKGKVSAKKTGTVKITATLTDGTKLTSKISVKKNEFSQKVSTNIYDYTSGVYVIPTKAYYDSKGNIKVKVRVINTSGMMIKGLTKQKITIKNSSKKVIASASVGAKKFNMYSGKYTDITYTISKKYVKLNKKKGDLRTSKISVKGKYYY